MVHHISIIVVNYNGLKWLQACFDSIFRQTYNDFELIVVDNASTDGSVDYLSKNYHQVHIIKSKTNLGFARGNNLGVDSTRGDIIFFLNTDTILKKDTLEKLITHKINKKLNIVGPKVLDFSGNDIHGEKKPSIDITGYIGYGRKTFYIDACAFIIGKKDFIYLGGFDDKYFMYSEDIDLCWRAHLYGMRLGVCRQATVKHYCGGTGGKTQYKRRGDHIVSLLRRYEVEKNNMRNLLKNYTFLNLIWVFPLFELQSLGESWVYLITGNFAAFRVISAAHLWNVRNVFDTFQKRRVVQKKRVVGDLYILSMMFLGFNKLLAFCSIGLPKFAK